MRAPLLCALCALCAAVPATLKDTVLAITDHALDHATDARRRWQQQRSLLAEPQPAAAQADPDSHTSTSRGAPVVMHIPKTAVDSLCQELLAAGTWPLNADGRSNVSCHGSHLDSHVREDCLALLPAANFTLTFARSPREHVISQYSECRFDKEWQAYRERKHQPMTVPGINGSDGGAFSEEYFAEWLRHTAAGLDSYECYHPHNMQSRYLAALSCARQSAGNSGAHTLADEADREPEAAAALAALARLEFVGVADLYDESWCALQHALHGELPADCTCEKIGLPKAAAKAARSRGAARLWHEGEVHDAHGIPPHPSGSELSPAIATLVDDATKVDRLVFANATARLLGELCDLQRASGTQLLCPGRMAKLRNSTAYVDGLWAGVESAAGACLADLIATPEPEAAPEPAALVAAQGEQAAAEAMSGPTVRFYLYEPQSLSSFAACERDPGEDKHAVARLLIERLERSAWRTSSMDDAQLFVVPALLDWVARGRCTGTEAEHIANLTATVAPHLHRGRHAIWATDFAAKKLREQVREKLPGIAFGTYLGVLSNETCVFNSGYSTYYDYVKAVVRQGGRGWEAKLPELDAPKPYLVEFAGQVFNPKSGRWRENFRHRWNLFHTSGLDRNRSFITTYTPRKLDENNPREKRALRMLGKDGWPVNETQPPECGPGDHYYCVGRFSHSELHAVRAGAEFSLMLRGDDESSDRLQNAVAALAIPIVVSNVSRSWFPLPHAIPWDELVVPVDAAAFDANASAAAAAAIDAVTPEQRARLRERLYATRRDLLFSVEGSRAAERQLQAAMLEPTNC